jgi:hypothetical protein
MGFRRKESIVKRHAVEKKSLALQGQGFAPAGNVGGALLALISEHFGL